MYTVAIAGSTNHTVMCAEALREDERFQIPWVLTPSPRLIGRKQVMTKNPLHVWAEKNEIPIVFVEKKIDEKVEKEIRDHSVGDADLRPVQEFRLDFLLVVDFGYLVPKWLLELPQIAPLNIHPSDLPKYRGSSPGQFTLLFGENKSAVTLMTMNESLDEGDLIHQINFDVPNTWMLQDFYTHAFTLVSEQLANLMADFGAGKLKSTPQPKDSPTPIARRLSREDGFIEWELLNSFLSLRERTQVSLQRNLGSEGESLSTSALLSQAYHHLQDWPKTIENAVRALSPWPGVWTIVPTSQGTRRMKLLEVRKNGSHLDLFKIQLEGSLPSAFSSSLLE